MNASVPQLLAEEITAERHSFKLRWPVGATRVAEWVEQATPAVKRFALVEFVRVQTIAQLLPVSHDWLAVAVYELQPASVRIAE